MQIKKTLSLLLTVMLLAVLFAGCAGGEAAAADGPRVVDVALSGGGGKATVESPAALVTRDGADYATVVWSSSNYSYMIVDGTRYDPVNTEGNSTFEIPVTMDTDMAIVACTVAMGSPKEIEYTLRFDSASVKAEA